MFNKNLKNASIYTLSSCLILTLTACSSSNVPTSSPTAVPTVPISSSESASSNTSTTDLAFETLSKSLQEKYSTTATSFDTETYTLERNETLIMQLGFPITNDHNTYDMFQFFLDPELTIPVWRPSPRDYYVGDDKVKIKPKAYPLFRTEFQEESVRENADWGNVGTLYLAKYYDKEGHVTKEPQEVSIIKIKTELDRPEVSLVPNQYGLATLTWEPVEGATQYGIYTISIYDNEISDDELLMHWGTTTETSFSDFTYSAYDTSYITGVETNNILSINMDFTYTEEDTFDKAFVVIAESDTGRSEMSRIIRPSDYASLLPYGMDYDASEEQILTDDELNLPLSIPIEMCDGSSVLYPIEYDITSATPFASSIGESSQMTENGLAQRMSIIGTPKGTPFERVFYFYYYPEKQNLQEVLTAFMQRQKQLAPKGSGTNKQPTIKSVSTDTKEPITAQTDFVINDQIPITATNALSEYLAYNMLSGVTPIALDDFVQARDTEYLFDALFEAYYQNPLIFGFENAWVNTLTNELHIVYTLDRAEQLEHQEAVIKEAKQIVSTVIQPQMTDLEKEEALNAYLCDLLTYDFAALENAAQYDYQYADPEFDDTFTSYGALINKLCVCSGYAQTFKLLADLSGLDAIVVSGYLGNVGHAWNKVKLEDAWYTLDVTNNDIDFTTNALFNLSDASASTTLIEDKKFVLDANYSNYSSTKDSFEYYHLKDNYYPKEELTSVLTTALLSSETEILLRTDYDISDDELYDALMNSLEASHTTSLSDFHPWLGVIYLKK